MKTRYNYSNYGNVLRITIQDAKLCSHSGDCENDVLTLLKKRYIKKQVQNICPIKLVKELSEYGAWDENELSDHNRNIIRWAWISCCDISER